MSAVARPVGLTPEPLISVSLVKVVFLISRDCMGMLIVCFFGCIAHLLFVSLDAFLLKEFKNFFRFTVSFTVSFGIPLLLSSVNCLLGLKILPSANWLSNILRSIVCC